MHIQRGAALIEHTWKDLSQQKHSIRIIFHENKFAHTREHFKENNILNIYQLNTFNNRLFPHRVKNGKMPYGFLCKFLRLSHYYPTSFSGNNYIVPSFKLTKSKYGITIPSSGESSVL